MYKINEKKELKDLINEFKEHYEEYDEYYQDNEPFITTYNNFAYNIWRKCEKHKFMFFNCVCNEKIPVYKIIDHLQSSGHKETKADIKNLNSL